MMSYDELYKQYKKYKLKYENLKSVYNKNGKYYVDKNDEVDIVYKNKSLLYTIQSKYQEIQVFYHDFFGNILVIDGDLQLTEHDEQTYHEMLVHVPLNYMENSKKVLIIGGGDCGTLTEVCKHPNIQEIIMVEIDEEVVKTALLYFKKLTAGFYDKRTKIVFADGSKWVKQNLNKYQQYFDIIIVDSTDYSTALSLFTNTFYRNISKLVSDRGIFCFNCMSISWMGHYLDDVNDQMKKYFRYVNFYQAFIPTYASGHYGFCICSHFIDPINTPVNFSAFDRKNIICEYYNQNIHIASFHLPNKYTEKNNTKHDLGTLFTVNIKEVSFDLLNNVQFLTLVFDEICKNYKLNVVSKSKKQFKPHGVTITYLLSESHLCIHTWPEYGKCCIDMFTCGQFTWFFNPNGDNLRMLLSNFFNTKEENILLTCNTRSF